MTKLGTLHARFVPSIKSLVVLCGLILSLGSAFGSCSSNKHRNPTNCTASDVREWPIPPSWLIREVTFDEAADRHMVDGVPFGAINDQWEELLSLSEAGDELWFYDSSSPVGMSGYLLVRDCEVVFNLVVSQYE